MATATAVLTNWHPNKRHSEIERWVCIYPAYINSNKTRQEGRRLPKEKCIDNPSIYQMVHVLTVTRLPIHVESKQYSRERKKIPLLCGRLRVQMRNDDGTPINPDLTTRDSIMLYIAEHIPQLKYYPLKSDPSDTKLFSCPSPGGIGIGPGVAAGAPPATGGGGGGGKKHRGKRR